MLLNPLEVARAMKNMAQASPDERAAKFAGAFASRDVLNAGKKYHRLVNEVGSEAEIAAADKFLTEHAILEISTYWPLQEANELKAELERRIEDLEDGHE